jgi:hypothetical protein
LATWLAPEGVETAGMEEFVRQAMPSAFRDMGDLDQPVEIVACIAATFLSSPVPIGLPRLKALAPTVLARFNRLSNSPMALLQ